MTFFGAKHYVANNNSSGFSEADQPMAHPFLDPSRLLCTPVWKSQKKISPIMEALNAVLPISDDVELLKGGIIYDCMLHEMLINTKKTLAVKRYCEMAARLTTPGSFPVWLLHGVPIAFAGKCEEKGDVLKSYDLKGSVTIHPVAEFSPGEKGYENNLRKMCKDYIP